MAPILPGTADRFVAGTVGAADASPGAHRRPWHETSGRERSGT